jgi:DeoR/GlpR family transcriptional regulator of sugar metabolism
MFVPERHTRIIETLEQYGSAKLKELSLAVGASVSTVRRDLKQLEGDGKVRLIHGGAVYAGDSKRVGYARDMAGDIIHGRRSDPVMGDALSARLNERVTAKRKIAKKAARMVKAHMTLLLDGGSTVIYTIRQITVRPLQIVTNSLAVANHFFDDEQVELTMVGGWMYPRSGVLVGPMATGCLADLHGDLCFFSAAAIQEDVAYNINIDMARVEQTMIGQATRSVMLMDASKFGRKSLVRVCSLSEVDQIITNDTIDNAWRERLGERLVVAR